MSSTLVLPQGLADELDAQAREASESAGVLLASIVHWNDRPTRLLGREMLWIDDKHYFTRRHDKLSIKSEGYIHALGLAERMGAMAIWLHTHPGIDAVPLPSQDDRLVDTQIADLFRMRSGSQYYGALIVSPRGRGFAFKGHLETEQGENIDLERLWIVGSRLKLVTSFDSQVREPLSIFDRNIRAFGGAVQETLAGLHIGVVGCGGTGSSVAEQIVRLGVRNLVLIDPDEISESNITRVYGSVAADVGRPKVEVLADHLLRIAPNAHVQRVQSMITVEATARRLMTCDAVFGCTDDNAGRLVLSRLATYLLTPVIDCGVLLSNDVEGNLVGIDGRVTVLTPGEACLVCRGRIDIARASAELLTPEERVRRADEGYAPGLGNVEPAVVAYTTLVAAAAVSELLERLIGYGPEPRPSEVLLRCHDREISTNVVKPRERHYCHPETGKLGLGPTTPFLEQVWTI